MSLRKDTIVFFEQRLADFFRKVGRDHLPWRRRGITAYEVWVSEIMLQQTQVSRVIGYYERFVQRFPTVESLAQTSWEDFLPYYQGLGYYARGRNMLRTAQVVVEKHNGVFPVSIELLDALPGIGPYTAAAIVSFAYDQNTVAWDTNLRRVIGRFFFGSKKSARIFELEGRFALRASELNAALMDLGSSLCTARPKCLACPIALKCRYQRDRGRQERLEYSRSNSDHSIRWQEAPVYIVVHEGHRTYFSENKTCYRPFILPSGFTDRAGIKRWFFERYDLVVSVRPPKKDIERKIVLVYVQILTGRHSFTLHPKSDFRRYILERVE